MMKSPAQIFKPIAVIAPLMLLLALLSLGCSRLDSPTASSTESTQNPDLWNPQPGDQIIPGQDVPLLNENYWESEPGQTINPFRLPSVGVSIGTAGGTINLGSHSCLIPAGAVNSLTLFTMTYASFSGVGVDCGPSPFTFNTPVMLTLSYAGTQYDNANAPPALQIFYMATDGSLTPLASTVNPGMRTVMAQVDHFSRYILG